MRRRANRDLSLGEGVLAVAGAMRPLATPRPQKGRTQTRRTPVETPLPVKTQGGTMNRVFNELA